jgi:hypothetical protein
MVFFDKPFKNGCSEPWLGKAAVNAEARLYTINQAENIVLKEYFKNRLHGRKLLPSDNDYTTERGV